MDDAMTGLLLFRGQKAVVTGGAGFIGSHVVRALLEAGAHVSVIDDFSTGNEANLQAHERLEIVRGSVSDAALVSRTIRGAGFVFHLAATSIRASLEDPVRDSLTNVLGTLHVLVAVRQTDGFHRMVYASTDSVYGNSRYLPINEDDLTSTLSPYAASKLAGENCCKAFYESYGVPVTMLRYANVYGPRQGCAGVQGGVVPRFIKNALSGESLPVYGDGQETRDFLFVDDTVEATLLAAVTPKADGQVYNVGSGFETTIVQVAKKILNLTNSPATLQFADKRDIDNIRRRALNVEKVRKDFRWTPKNTLDAGLRKTVDWHRKQQP